MKNKKRKLAITVYLSLIFPLMVIATQRLYNIYKGAVGKPANILINASSPQAEISPNLWQNFAQGGEEPKDMLGPVVDKIRLLQPKLIRIDHVFDHHQVVQADDRFDFSRLDQVVQSILRTGAKPMLSLSYIPSQLTTDGNITSPPKDWSRWEKLITATVEHYSGRGNLNINNVYYEVYNEPDLFGNWRYNGEPNYLTLYHHSAQGAGNARDINPYKIGGPATTGFYTNWTRALIDLCQSSNLSLDFISWHRYSPNLEDYDRDFEEITTILTDYPRYQGLERLITEFGPGPERLSWYENRVGAAQAIAVTAHLLDRVHRIFAFELKDGPNPATGGQASWGMLTHENNGARTKPRWDAYLFLNKLEGRQLPLEGNGDWVSGVATKINRETRVLLVNYDSQQTHSEYVPVRVNNLLNRRYRVSIDYLFGQDYQFQHEAAGNTFFYRVLLPPNEAVLITLAAQD